MITPEQLEIYMLAHGGVNVNTHCDDVFYRYTQFDDILNDLPDEFRLDLIGFQRVGIGFMPLFETKQSEWDKKLTNNLIDKDKWKARKNLEQ